MNSTCSHTVNQRKKVVLVDDDAFMIRVIKMKLEKAGYEVFSANNGLEGLEKIKEHKPNVVVADVCMPKMTGWEMCREVAACPDVAPDLIIIATSRIEREEREKINQVLNARFMEKPVSLKIILNTINQQFKQADGRKDEA